MKTLLLALLAVFCSAPLRAEKYTAEIKPLAGERWYGAYTAKANCNTPLKDITFQPYEANEKRKDLRTDNRGNQAVPVLISNKGRYVWSNEPFAFELKEGRLLAYSDYEQLAPVAAGKTLRDAYVGAKNQHFPASGKTPDPLMFRTPQYNMWIELGPDQDQPKVLKYAADVLAHGFPAGVFMIDDNWSNAFGNFEFDARLFPDPKGMVDELHGKGFRVMLWLTPFISPDSRVYRTLAEQKLLVLKADGNSPALIKWWDGYSACLDLTNPQAVAWLRGQLQGVQQKYGIDGFKFDAADFNFYSADPTNTTGTRQAEAYGKLGAEFAFNEFRAGWKNGNQPLAQRLQDKGYSWDDLTLLVPDMVSAGLIGHPFTCPDMIGGGLRQTFENIAPGQFDQELLIRSAQIQALMPMMQFSAAPWRVLDKEHLEMCRAAARLHAQMGDYLVQLARQAGRGGEPIVRHMEYAFPNQGFERSDDQYMLGDKYLVAPMVNKGTTRTVKLPKGNWTDELGQKYKGGRTVKLDVPLKRLVYFTYQK